MYTCKVCGLGAPQSIQARVGTRLSSSTPSQKPGVFQGRAAPATFVSSPMVQFRDRFDGQYHLASVQLTHMFELMVGGATGEEYGTTSGDSLHYDKFRLMTKMLMPIARKLVQDVCDLGVEACLFLDIQAALKGDDAPPIGGFLRSYFGCDYQWRRAKHANAGQEHIRSQLVQLSYALIRVHQRVRFAEEDPHKQELHTLHSVVTAKMDESVATEHSLKDLKARFPSLGVLGSFWAHDHDADTGTQLEALFENLIEILCGGHAGRALGKKSRSVF